MVFYTKHINLKIPIPCIFFDFKKSKANDKIDKKDYIYPIMINPEVGDIVVTKNGLDIGIVGEVKNQKVTRIYSRYNEFGLGEYGGIDTVVWYNVNINMTLEEWEKLCKQLKDASSFYEYWLNRLNIG